jgi:hypothetical protein
MSITFCVEAHSEAEDDALASENAPTLNVHNTGGWALLAVLGIEPDHYGTIDSAELLARIDAAPVGPIPEHPGLDYVVARLPRLRDVAVAAHRLGRQVVWG